MTDAQASTVCVHRAPNRTRHRTRRGRTRAGRRGSERGNGTSGGHAYLQIARPRTLLLGPPSQGSAQQISGPPLQYVSSSRILSWPLSVGGPVVHADSQSRRTTAGVPRLAYHGWRAVRPFLSKRNHRQKGTVFDTRITVRDRSLPDGTAASPDRDR